MQVYEFAASGFHVEMAGWQRAAPASSSPLSSVSSTQPWHPLTSPLRPACMRDRPLEQKQESGDHHAGMLQLSPPSHFYEELFCSSHTSNALVPLAGALLTTSGPQSDVVKQGYLGKLERNHRRYFVLRAGSHTGPSRLEWYKSREKFTAAEKTSTAGLFGSSKQGVIYLRCCLGVSRTGSTRKGHTVMLYDKDQTLVLVVEDQWEQDEWYVAIRKVMEEEKDEQRGEELDEDDDDGYCTLPPAAFFKEVWRVTVKPRGPGSYGTLAGESRLCLTASSLIVVRAGACSHLPSVTIPLVCVRRFGHQDGSFFLELGRSAPSGPGELWMEAQGNPAVAQNIHEVVRETIRARRALPDFSRSPTSNPSQLQALVASKHCRPKYRPKSSSRPAPRNPESPAGTESYVEMNTDPVNKHRGGNCGMEAWEPRQEEEEEDEEEGLGYMMMSPQTSHSSPALCLDDYETMASPRKHNSTLQTSFNSSASDDCSPLHPSHRHVSELSWSETEAEFARPAASSPARSVGDSAASHRPVRRHGLSSCLLSCLQAEDGS